MLGSTYLQENFRTVRENTIVIAEEIPADHYTFRAAPSVRSVGEMLAHVAVAPRWQMSVHRDRTSAIDFGMFAARNAGVKAGEEALQTKEQIVAALKDGRDQFVAFLDGLTPDTLGETITFPPPIQPATKSRFELLMSLKEHEMHHRGQLMLIQRILGIVPHLTRRREAFAAQLPAQS
ncbi:MAG TPA: DinB family protein [Vicinamibacterales bacterium]|jgi:uncharacterized damage-inducible protein DinB|nr:DinB family protein [Vicinamibacterales bacterium]